MVKPCEQCMTDTLESQLQNVKGRMLCANCASGQSDTAAELRSGFTLGGIFLTVAPLFASARVNSLDYVSVIFGLAGLGTAAAAFATRKKSAAPNVREYIAMVVAFFSLFNVWNGFHAG